MGHKIFISYKYHDNSVLPLANITGEVTTARHYVDALQELLDEADHVNKGEMGGESLHGLSEDSIEAKLRDKVFDSTVTIVLLSPNMREGTPDAEQWTPWEVSYSLKSKTRSGVTRKPNALIGVVLPDTQGSYDYHLIQPGCIACQCRLINHSTMFSILSGNLFNAKEMILADPCADHTLVGTTYKGAHSFMVLETWSTFTADIGGIIKKAVANNEAWNSFKVAVSA